MMTDTQIDALLHEVLEKGLGVKNEQLVHVYDEDSPLACLLAKAYQRVLPQAQHVLFNPEDTRPLAHALMALPAGSTVILTQSRNFRLDDFRIRLQLFNAGVGCLEHTHLGYCEEHEMDLYLEAFRYRGEAYKKEGEALAEALENAEVVEVLSEDGSLLHFGAMEPCKINHGIFHEQKNRGGAAICGELFTEARDFSKVSGRIMVKAYPGVDWKVKFCEPFWMEIQASFVTAIDPKAPQDFLENVVELIKASEDGELMVREAGFGLNPAISYEQPLAEVSSFERMKGFHLSLGKKHEIYRHKLDKKVVQRYHMDVFVGMQELRVNGEVYPFFES